MTSLSWLSSTTTGFLLGGSFVIKMQRSEVQQGSGGPTGIRRWFSLFVAWAPGKEGRREGGDSGLGSETAECMHSMYYVCM